MDHWNNNARPAFATMEQHRVSNTVIVHSIMVKELALYARDRSGDVWWMDEDHRHTSNTRASTNPDTHLWTWSRTRTETWAWSKQPITCRQDVLFRTFSNTINISFIYQNKSTLCYNAVSENQRIVTPGTKQWLLSLTPVPSCNAGCIKAM